MQNLTNLTIYKHTITDPQKHKEVRQASLFFDRLREFVPVRDVVFGSNPPDFVLFLESKKVALELTTLDRAVFPKGKGDRKRGEYSRWGKEQAVLKPTTGADFQWGKSTFSEILTALRQQLTKKSEKAIRYQDQFDDLWLLVDVGQGNPMDWIVSEYRAVKGEEFYAETKAKVLYELAAICKQPRPFSHILFFSLQHLLAFTSTNNSCGFPVPDPSLLTLGRQLPASLLTYRHEIKITRSLGWKP